MEFFLSAAIYLIVALPVASIGLLVWTIASALDRGGLPAALHSALVALIEVRLADGQELLDAKHSKRLDRICDRADKTPLEAQTADLTLAVALEEPDPALFCVSLAERRARLLTAAQRRLRCLAGSELLAKDIIDTGPRRIVEIRWFALRRSMAIWGPPVLQRMGRRLLPAVAVGGLAGLMVGSVVSLVTATGEAADGLASPELGQVGAVSTLGMLLAILWVLSKLFLRVRRLDLAGLPPHERALARRRETVTYTIVVLLLLISATFFVTGTRAFDFVGGLAPDVPTPPEIDIPLWAIGTALVLWGLSRAWRLWRTRMQTSTEALFDSASVASGWIAFGVLTVMAPEARDSPLFAWVALSAILLPMGLLLAARIVSLRERSERNRELRAMGVEIRWVTPPLMALALILGLFFLASAMWLLTWWSRSFPAAPPRHALWGSAVIMVVSLPIAGSFYWRQKRRVRAEMDRRVREFRSRRRDSEGSP